MRRTLKDTFASSTDLNILVSKDASKKPNCRVQVLPVQWRQEIQFGASKEYNDSERRYNERDIGDVDSDDEMGYDENPTNATLKDITVEGLAPIRNLISDGTPFPPNNTNYSFTRYPALLHTPIPRTHRPRSRQRNEPHIHSLPSPQPQLLGPRLPPRPLPRLCNLL